MLSRRDCLKSGGLGAVALATCGCSQLAGGLSQPPLRAGWGKSEDAGQATGATVAAALRLLNRAAFGPRPDDLARLLRIGPDAYLDEQLHPDRLEETPAIGWRLWRLDSLQVDTDFRFDLPKEQVQAELQQATVIRTTYAARQLQEVMVDFWTDHFNISQLKGDGAFMKTADDDAVIRKHALGKFRDLLWASAKSPAMLYYLDNYRNTRRAGNENYARELMELHTLGVDGGYTQRDVQEVARCFTGWSIRHEGTWQNGTYLYHPEDHDDGSRSVLGQLLPAGLGEKQGERVLDILADHPATARFIARKLCHRFIADDIRPYGRLIERLAGTFRRTDGDIRQVVGALLRSEAFRDNAPRKLKRPFDFAISSLRALNADTNGQGVLPHLRRMGQPPYQWAMPNGYPDRAEAWTSSLLGRWNFALALCSGQIEGTRVDFEALQGSTGSDDPARVLHGLQSSLLGHVQRRLDAALGAIRRQSHGQEALAQASALILASPDFQWR